MSEKYLGQIMMAGFGFAPRFMAQCNGQLLAINQNQALFSLLGIQYGGNGTTNFALPDLRSRTPIGYASSVDPSWQPPSVQIGQASGVENVTLPLIGEVRAWQFAFIVVGLPGFPIALWLFTLREPARRRPPARRFHAV